MPVAAVGMTFGLLAAPVLGAVPSIVLSAAAWAGAAQFAALSVVASGGGTALAAGAGLLANARFLPMGFAIAPSMTGGPLRRFLKGSVLSDASFVIGNRGGGRFDISALVWAFPLQYFPWIAGTIVGVVGATAIGDPTRWGLDVLFPVFYLSLLLPELFPDRFQGHRRRARRARDRSGVHGSTLVLTRPIIVAVMGAAITLALTPIAPAGVPILVAASAALIGLRPPRQSPAGAGDEA
ncbi:MAG TPA: AzlC family ABC transporter permease [Propionibacteriaceae bacterium]|nr:AzlC family ABC transporter permease [Propionibacteriaceae bacterium]